MDSVAERTRTKKHTVNSIFWTPEWDRVRNEQHTINHGGNIQMFRKFAKEQGFEITGEWFDGTTGPVKAIRIKK